jgi:HAD superfamily hydrolase (TIGR01662 family)
MSVEAVILDLDGTLLPKGTSTPTAGVPDMIRALKQLNLRLAVASNNASAGAVRRLQAAGLPYDLVVAPDVIPQLRGKPEKKPSPEFCYEVLRQFRLTHSNQLLYVGDSDTTDAICAVNAGVLYANAGWSNSGSRYGLQLNAPMAVPMLVWLFLQRQPVWHHALDVTDGDGRPVHIRTLSSARSDWNQQVTSAFKAVLKSGVAAKLGSVDAEDFLLLYLLTTIYLTGMYAAVDWWACYPSSTAGQINPKLRRFLDLYAKLFRDRFLGDLLVRHTSVVPQHQRRMRRQGVQFVDQMNSVQLNPAHRPNVRDKHVVVLDDFTTEGNSFECARLLLQHGGARQVTCVGIGSHRFLYDVQTPRAGLIWDPWQPNRFEPADFASMRQRAVEDPRASAEFLQILNNAQQAP